MIGGVEDALILLGFVLISISITLYQERRSESALEAIKDLSSPKSLVIRNGVRNRIHGRELVPGAATARVTATGLNTEIGKIGKSLSEISSSESPLQADIRVLIKRMAIFGVSLALLVFMNTL